MFGSAMACRARPRRLRKFPQPYSMLPLKMLTSVAVRRELERLSERGESSMLFVLAWGLICFGVFKIFGPVALLIFIAITIGALVVTTIRAWHKWQGRQ
jgi:hypothetical protein